MPTAHPEPMGNIVPISHPAKECRQFFLFNYLLTGFLSYLPRIRAGVLGPEVVV